MYGGISLLTHPHEHILFMFVVAMKEGNNLDCNLDTGNIGKTLSEVRVNILTSPLRVPKQ